MIFVPLQYKIAGAAALVCLLGAGHLYRVKQADSAGYDRAVTERAARDGVAIIARTKENATLAVKQDDTNRSITKAKNDEIATVARRIAAERVRVGPAICGPAPPAKAEDAPGSDSGDSSGRLVREDIERDIRALKLAVEQDLATARACQAWGRENGFVP